MMFASTPRPTFDPAPYSRWVGCVERRISPAAFIVLPNAEREHYTYTPRVGDGLLEAQLLEANPLLVWFRASTRVGWRDTAATFVLADFVSIVDSVRQLARTGDGTPITIDHVDHFRRVLTRTARAGWLRGNRA